MSDPREAGAARHDGARSLARIERLVELIAGKVDGGFDAFAEQLAEIRKALFKTEGDSQELRSRLDHLDQQIKEATARGALTADMVATLSAEVSALKGQTTVAAREGASAAVKQAVSTKKMAVGGGVLVVTLAVLNVASQHVKDVPMLGRMLQSLGRVMAGWGGTP